MTYRYADIVDSRDLIELLDEYNARRDELVDEGRTEAEIDDVLTDEFDEAEVDFAKAALDECGDADDWTHGLTLISDSHFVDYAQQLAEDIGALDRDAQWPLYHIDWEAAAESLQMDYTSVILDGVAFWYR